MKQCAARAGILYGCLIFSLLLCGLGVLAEPIRNAVPETDNWWMLPVFSHYLQGNNPLERLILVLPRFLHYMNAPAMKIILWVIDDFLRLPFRYFLWAGVLIHLLNSFLLAWLCRLLGLSRRIAVASSMIFWACFVHFHGYLWLPSSQHPHAVSTVLTVLCLFLLTERRVREGRPFRGLYGLTALASVAGSLQHCGFIVLPLMIGAAWVVPAWTVDQRQRLHARWLPVWILSLVYPIVLMAYSGDDSVALWVAKGQSAPWIKATGLLGAGIGTLLLLGWLLRFQRFSSRIALVLGGVAWMALALRDSRQVLLPYNALVPWMTVLGSFLDPIRTALKMEARESYYYMEPQVSLFHLGAVLFMLGTFILGFVRRKRELALLGFWYGIVVVYLLVHRHVASSMPFVTQSRYFLYVTPLFAIALGSLTAYGVALLGRKAGWGEARRDLVMAGILLALCVPNLLAIRIALFRGRLTNTYLVYDDVRLARLIRGDLARKNAGGEAPRELVVQNAVPTLFSRFQWMPPFDYGRIGHANLRRFLREAFEGEAPRSVKINEAPPKSAAAAVYRVEADQVLDGQGRSIERFSELFGEAVVQFNEGNQKAALDLFKKAALERPFLLNYVLSRDLRLADLFWVTGGEDLRDFFEHIGARHRIWGTGPVEKAQRTSELIEAELSNYLLCLLCLSYLEQEVGHLQESRFWASQLWFIERDPVVLVEWLQRTPEVRSSESLRLFLNKVKDPFFFREPWVWKKEDYALGRFLIRLLFHWDIRSRWDNRFGVVL